jgi:hypothetical protein
MMTEHNYLTFECDHDGCTTFQEFKDVSRADAVNMLADRGWDFGIALLKGTSVIGVRCPKHASRRPQS